MQLSKWPFYNEEQINAVANVLYSGKVNNWTGQETNIFEKEFAKWCGSKYSVAMANGSLALSSAYLALGIKKDDQIITTPRTFIATSSSIALLGAKPVFADVDLDSGAITAQTIEPLINKKTKAISVVHLGGWPADMVNICALAKSHNLKVVEDCAQSHGATINGKSVGSFGDVSAWSFCQDKIISTGGEGGMITTSSEEIWDKIWSFKDHGKAYKLVKGNKNNALFNWVHERFGSNFRLTEMQSAIGRLQLKKLAEWNDLRNRNAKILYEKLKLFTNIRIPIPPKNFKHAWYKFHFYIVESSLSNEWCRDKIIFKIREEGYPAYQGSCSEIYLEKCIKDAGFAPKKRLPNAKKLGETSIMLLVHPTLTYEEMTSYAEVVSRIIKNAKKR